MSNKGECSVSAKTRSFSSDYKPLVVSPPGCYQQRTLMLQQPICIFEQLPPCDDKSEIGIVSCKTIKPGLAEQQKCRGSSAHLRSLPAKQSKTRTGPRYDP
jgi:hypothetical protein